MLGGRTPTADDVPRLPTTAAVLSESMRLYPPAWAIGRRALKDHRADGFVDPGRLGHRGIAVAPAPRRALVAGAHDVPAWIAGPTRRRRTTPPCLHPVRRRTPHVHRRRVRADGGVLLLATIAQRWRFQRSPRRRWRCSRPSPCAPATGCRCGRSNGLNALSVANASHASWRTRLTRYPPDMAFSSALVLFAHPDDAEFMCGGTIAKWAREGCEVHYVVVTDGSAGSNEPGVTREELASDPRAGAARRGRGPGREEPSRSSASSTGCSR